MNPHLDITVDSITHVANTVEYRRKVQNGIRVVQVFFTTETPRMIAFTEHYCGRIESSPMSLFKDEIDSYFADAERRIVEMRAAQTPKENQL